MKLSTLGGHRWRHGLPSGSAAVRPVHLFREDEVVQAGAVEHGVVDAVAPEAAVAEDHASAGNGHTLRQHRPDEGLGGSRGGLTCEIFRPPTGRTGRSVLA